MSRRSLMSSLAVSLLVMACGSSASPSASTPAGAPSAAAPSIAASTAASPKETPTATPKPEVAAACAKRDLKFGPKIDLTGPWAGDDDGIYYLRQLDKTLWWSGMSNRDGLPKDLGRDWNNVATGQIGADLTIKLDWADVPRGQVQGHGTLTWKVEDDGTGNAVLTKIAETGTGFGGSKFTPCSPG